MKLKVIVIVFFVIFPVFASADIDVSNMEKAFNEQYIPEAERACYKYELEFISMGKSYEKYTFVSKYRYKITLVWKKKGLIFREPACPHESHKVIPSGEYGLQVTVPDEYGQQKIIIIKRFK